MGVRLPCIMLVALLSGGCVITQTTGKRLGEVDQPLTGLLVIAFDDGQFNSKSEFGAEFTQRVIGETTKTLLTTLESRLPPVFSLNGIKVKYSLRSKDKKVSFSSADQPYFMTLSPASGTYSTRGHVTVFFHCAVTEFQTKRVVWKGTVHFAKYWPAPIDNGAVDEFAKALLMQLAKDRIVVLPQEEPLMPERAPRETDLPLTSM